jgi:hypothetical protein
MKDLSATDVPNVSTQMSTQIGSTHPDSNAGYQAKLSPKR